MIPIEEIPFRCPDAPHGRCVDLLESVVMTPGGVFLRDVTLPLNPADLPLDSLACFLPHLGRRLAKITIDRRTVRDDSSAACQRFVGQPQYRMQSAKETDDSCTQQALDERVDGPVQESVLITTGAH